MVDCHYVIVKKHSFVFFCLNYLRFTIDFFSLVFWFFVFAHLLLLLLTLLFPIHTINSYTIFHGLLVTLNVEYAYSLHIFHSRLNANTIFIFVCLTMWRLIYMCYRLLVYFIQFATTYISQISMSCLVRWIFIIWILSLAMRYCFLFYLCSSLSLFLSDDVIAFITVV